MEPDVATAPRGLTATRVAIAQKIDCFHPIARARPVSRVSAWLGAGETLPPVGASNGYQTAKKWLYTKTAPVRSAVAAQLGRGEQSMSSTTAPEWDVDKIIHDGVVAVRDLSQHTTQVLKAVEARGRPILVTRNGRVVASIAPITMREVVDQIVANHADVRDSLTAAEQALREGNTQSIHKLPTSYRLEP